MNICCDITKILTKLILLNETFYFAVFMDNGTEQDSFGKQNIYLNP